MGAEWWRVALVAVPLLITVGVIYGTLRTRANKQDEAIAKLEARFKEELVVCKERLDAHSNKLDNLNSSHNEMDKLQALMNQKLDTVIKLLEDKG